MTSYKEKLKEIKALFFDVDGVFTNSEVLLSADGELLRSMNTRDGYALKAAIVNGFDVCIISGGKQEAVRMRMEALGVKNIFLGIEDKLSVFKTYCEKQNIKASEVMYVGDDIPDYEVMQQVGLAVAPNDAANEIKEIAHYISYQKGGEGCVRDILEQLLKDRGLWMNNVSKTVAST